VFGERGRMSSEMQWVGGNVFWLSERLSVRCNDVFQHPLQSQMIHMTLGTASSVDSRDANFNQQSCYIRRSS
jgi:hypothetical protein